MPLLFQWWYFLVAFALTVSYMKGSIDALSSDDVDVMKEELLQHILSFDVGFVDGAMEMPMMAGCVRLVFHDCVGGICDGCIDYTNPENAGLKRYIDKLDEYWTPWKAKISRADYWSLCAIVSMELGAELTPPVNNIKAVPSIKFKYGRVDHAEPCPSRHLPDPNDNPISFLTKEFKISAEEGVALMGAHTLGRAHPDASGYKNSWVTFPDWLHNEYYADLLDQQRTMNWHQIEVRRKDGSLSKIQWDNDDPKPSLMLHADIHLIKKLTLVEYNGIKRSTCSFHDCPYADTASIVARFAYDNEFFMDVFSTAMDKMMCIGNDNLQLPQNY